jgi:RNA polymerase sigma-70 factor, ECF subfamily
MNDARHQIFSDLMARCQSDLYSYIFAIVQNWDDADDLLQSVALVLWRKFDSFRVDSNFLFWATRTAKIEVSNFLRQRHLSGCASNELLDAIGETVVEIQSEGRESYLTALGRCKEKLSGGDLELLELHYVEDLGSRQIADQLKRPQPSVCHSLNRIRSWLFECVQMELARREHPGKQLS